MEGCVFIPDVTTESRQWRCKVAVVQKLNTQESRRTPGKKYKPIILQDEAGNRVQAMVYDNDIDGLDKRLEVSSTYIICNASVTSVVGLSLGTRYNTSIEVDPVNDGAKALNDWKDKNSELIYKAIVDKSYLDSLLTLADPIRQRKTCLSALEAEFEQVDLRESNDGLFRQSLMLGNPTKRRLDFSQLSGDSVDDAQASSPPKDKGKKPKID
nr:replication protein A 70 kDa DNA-binding subunit B-like [Ipomoea batatas]